MKGKPGLVVAIKPGIAFDDLRFGFKKGPFTNQKLRQAVAYAIDKDEINKATSGARASLSRRASRPGMPFHGASPRPGPLREAERPAGEAAHAGSRLQGGEGRPHGAPGAGPDRPGRGGHPGPAPGGRHERRGEDARVGGPPGGLEQGRLRAVLFGAHPAAGRRRLLLPDERVDVEQRRATRTPTTTASAKKAARRRRQRTARRSTPSSNSSAAPISPTTRPTITRRWRHGERTSRAGITGLRATPACGVCRSSRARRRFVPRTRGGSSAPRPPRVLSRT